MNPSEQRALTREVLETWLHDAPGFVGRCADRVTASDGGRKYHDTETDTMLFETMSLEDLYRFTEEEVLDVPNYAVMLSRRGVVGAEHLARLAHELWEELARVRANN